MYLMAAPLLFFSFCASVFKLYLALAWCQEIWIILSEKVRSRQKWSLLMTVHQFILAPGKKTCLKYLWPLPFQLDTMVTELRQYFRFIPIIAWLVILSRYFETDIYICIFFLTILLKFSFFFLWGQGDSALGYIGWLS